jgi:cytochrome P450
MKFFFYSSTPYAEAIIQEVFRMSSIIPFNVIHSTTQDVEFHGYTIPKDTLVISNLHSVHHKVKTWGDPENDPRDFYQLTEKL